MKETAKKKVKVAIIDSGICKKFDDEMGQHVERYEVKKVNGELRLLSGGIDDNGHGTMCASIIQKECSDIEIISIKVFNDSLQTEMSYLIYALESLLNSKVKIINMSLAITAKVDTKELYEICRKLYMQGKILVASVANGKSKSIPAKYPFVIGVKGDKIKEDLWNLRFQRSNFIKQSISCLEMDKDGKYEMFGSSNSGAAASMTGMIASLLSEKDYPALKEVLHELNKASCKRFSWEANLKRNRIYPVFKVDEITYQEDIMKKLQDILCDFFHLYNKEHLYQYALFSSKIGGRSFSYFSLIKRIQQEFGLQQLNYRTITKYDFVSIYTVYDWLMRERNE